MIKEPKSASEAFVQKQEAIKKRGSAIDIGMGVGNALTNATNLVVAMIKVKPEIIIDEQDIKELITKWTDIIYRIGQDKKDYESIPVTEEEIIPIKEGEEPPQDYVKRSKLDDLKVEEERSKDLPF